MNNMSADDLLTIAHLYCTSLNMRLAWARIPEAVDSGYTAKRLTSKLHDNDMQIQMLPILAQGLLMSNRVIDCVDILKELDYIRSQTNDQSAEVWYHACCLDIILETGFQLEPYQRCVGFAGDMGAKPSCQHSQAVRYFMNCCVALWYMRKGDQDQMRLHHEAAMKYAPSQLENYVAARGFAKLLEIKLILLSTHLSKGKKTANHILNLEAQIKVDLGYLAGQCNHLPVIQPRLLHLRAYWEAIHQKYKSASRLLSRCVSLSDRLSCPMELQWAAHSQLAWFDPDFDKMQANFWLEHSDEDMLDWHMAEEVDPSLIKYSLPLPVSLE